MTPEQHYEAAEALLDRAAYADSRLKTARVEVGSGQADPTVVAARERQIDVTLARAQVHAMLALAVER